MTGRAAAEVTWRYRRLRCASTCPRARTGTRRTAWPRGSWPVIPGKAGACCAMARSCSRTGAHCSPTVRRSRRPRRRCVRGWRSSGGRHEEDGGRWLMPGRRGKTRPMCADCCRKGNLSSPQHSKPQCSNGPRGTSHTSRPRNRQPGVGTTGGRREGSRPLPPHRRCHGPLADVPYGTGADRRPEGGITADQSMPRGHRAHCLGGRA